MDMIDNSNDFNLNALVLGVGILLLCLLVQVIVIHYAVVVISYLQKRRMYLTGLRELQLTFFLGAVVLVFIHLLHIYIWGYSLYLTSIITPLNKAIIFAGSTYTTVGFAGDPMKADWQLLTIIMATSGLFSFGLSTSIMFTLTHRIFAKLQSLRNELPAADA
jgi:hypothetical protein